MAKRESILEHTLKTVKRVRVSLKARGITVPDVDGPSDEPQLRGLQELQAVADALESSEQAPTGTVTLTDVSDSVTRTASFPSSKAAK